MSIVRYWFECFASKYRSIWWHFCLGFRGGNGDVAIRWQRRMNAINRAMRTGQPSSRKIAISMPVALECKMSHCKGFIYIYGRVSWKVRRRCNLFIWRQVASQITRSMRMRWALTDCILIYLSVGQGTAFLESELVLFVSIGWILCCESVSDGKEWKITYNTENYI